MDILAEIQKDLDHKADTLNANRGSVGTNIAYDKAQGNRGKQLNPNQNYPYYHALDSDSDDIEGEVYGPLDSSD